MLHCGAICKHYRHERAATNVVCAYKGVAGYPLSLSDTRLRSRLAAMDTDIAHALVRFGLGRRGYEPLPTDPGAWARA